jgi:prolyl-tRNA synthetase
MRMSNLFGQTLREAPADAEIPSHQLLVRAGFIRQLGAGIFSYLLLAKRALTKIENIMREEINAIGGQELAMPVIHPADIWKETGRWYQIGAEMGRFKDKSGRDMALAMTHEEVVADLVRREIQSYRQLPMLVYHIQTKWRDDPRPRAGLIRVREFTMLDSYSLDADEASLDRQYRAHYQAYFNIFNRCGLPTIAVKSDVGMMGGSLAHEFMYLTPFGEDTLLLCDQCGYSANRQIARFRKPAAASEQAAPLERVATPNVTTIEALAQFLGVPKARTAKAVFLVATQAEGGSDGAVDRFVFALVRGDMEVNETKLANALRAKELRPAREDEIRAVGAVPGYASPVGLDPQRVLVVVDDAIPASPNLVGGANEAGYHMRGVNYGRDYSAPIVADIAAAGEGDACPNCGAALGVSRGVEVGNIFKLGTRYTDALGATFLERDGSQRAVIMGSYGIGSGRLLACVAEAHHDADGLRWPITVAPFHVHLVVLPEATGQAQAEAEALYLQLQTAGVEVLFDDRDERPGVKFKDADLIGLPLRVTVSERALRAGGVEFKRRTAAGRETVPLDQALPRLQTEIAALLAEIAATVRPVTYPEA